MMNHYLLVLDDGGRNTSKRPGQFNDCSVRAIAIASHLSYDTIYETLARAGRKPCQGFDSNEWLRSGKCKSLGFRARAVSVLRLTPLSFSLRHPRGRFILETECHTWAVIDGVHHDMIRTNKPLVGAWRIT